MTETDHFASGTGPMQKLFQENQYVTKANGHTTSMRLEMILQLNWLPRLTKGQIYRPAKQRFVIFDVSSNQLFLLPIFRNQTSMFQHAAMILKPRKDLAQLLPRCAWNRFDSLFAGEKTLRWSTV
ncbi:MAG: hypothetical protein WBH04_06885, partial [Albidovulum sp.]